MLKKGLSAFFSLMCCGALHARCRVTVFVSDPAGRPVVGAEVRTIGMSTTSGPNLTNAEGKACAPFVVQKPIDLVVSKPGFQEVHSPAPFPKKLHITLVPVR